ncbi:glycosyltransferase family 2 protein [Aeromonas caviae]
MYSVVIPTYNSTHTIERTITSVLNQTLMPNKIIIVDDMSEDVSDLKCQLSKFNNLVFLVESENKSNAANNRNRGWTLVEDEIVFFLDSDDEWLPSHAEYVIKYFDLNKDTDCVYTSFIVKQEKIDPFLGNFKTIDMKAGLNPLDLLFVGGFDFRSSCIALRKNVMKKAMFDGNLKKHQDWDFFMTLTKENVVVDRLTIPSVIINEVGAGRMSAKNNLNASFYFIEKWWGYANKFNLSRLFTLFYISAYKNDLKTEVDMLNEKVNEIGLGYFKAKVTFFRMLSKLSYVFSRLVLLTFLKIKNH